MIYSLLVVLGCRKHNSQTKWLKGEWNLVDYYQIDSYGITNHFKPASGKMLLSGLKSEKTGDISMKYNFQKEDSIYEINLKGTYKSISLDSILVDIEGSKYFVLVEKQAINDMHWTSNITSLPYDGMIWKRR
jgi:hypothetical protein